MLKLILMVFAFVLACVAAGGIQTAGRWHLGWAALAFFFLAMLLGGIGPAGPKLF